MIVAASAAFHAVLQNDFVNWGDHADLVNNPNFRGLDANRLVWMFTTIQMGHYQPLSWLTFAGDYLVWGMNPAGYHLGSLVWHVLCSVAVFDLLCVLLRLPQHGAAPDSTYRVEWFALLAAMLFSLHPLRVETVAWATERRGALSGLFFVLAVSFYLRYVLRRRRAARMAGGLRTPPRAFESATRAYRFSVIAFALSLLAKEFGVTLPAVLLILDAFPLRRLRGARRRLARRLVPLLREKAPYIGLSALGCLIAALSSLQSQVALSLGEYGFSNRVAQAAYALMLYLSKTVWPAGLSPIYEIPAAMNPADPLFLGSAAGIVLLSGALWLLRRRLPALLAAWACVVVILLPVLGLFQTGRQLAADRYTYLPAIAFSALIAGGLASAARRVRPAAAAPGAVVSVTILLVLIVFAWRTDQQCRVWRNSETLWTHALRVQPESSVAATNLGLVRVQQERLDEGITLLQRAIRLDPRSAEAHNNCGIALAKQGDLNAAIEHFEAGLRIKPEHPGLWGNLERARALRKP